LQVDLMLAQVQDLMNEPNDALRGFESVLATLSAAADCDVCEANWRVLTEVEARISSARLLRELKRAPESLTEARRAWQFAKEQLGATHPISLTAANEVSSSLLEAGEREQALREAELAYQERLRLLGNSHWQTLSAQNNLAMVKEGLGAGEEAERMLEDALAIGGGDPSANQVVIATIEDNLGRLRFLARDTGRAEQLMKRAYERRVEGLGPNHPDTVQAASNLSVLYSQIGKFDAAKPLMEAAVRGTTARFGAEHRESLRVRSEYASLLRNSGDYLAADAEFGKVLEASLRSFSVGDTDRLRVLYQYSGSLQRQERWAEAERMSRQLMDEARVASDPTAAHALLAPLRHARSLMGLRRYADAEPLLVALERSLGAVHQAQMREMTRQSLAELRAAKAAP
jgi:tetratricopeptide (TPR) repeat protein